MEDLIDDRCIQVADIALIDLGQSLKELVSLETIELDLGKRKIEEESFEFIDVGINGLGQGLKSLVSLRKMNLSFIGYEIDFVLKSFQIDVEE